jgi:hypothetical protein
LAYSQESGAPKTHRDAPQTTAANMMIVETEKRVNMSYWQTPEGKEFVAILRKVHGGGLPRYPLLAIFFTGGSVPPDCVPMLRSPAPEAGFIFDDNFGDHFRDAVAINDSAHDGAVAFGRMRVTARYRCMGWSYRIVAAAGPREADANRGAAYNSAISLSLSPAVDCVCLFSSSEMEVFSAGTPVLHERS